jgi:MtrB/PioB family decaheme-associated outer membrane protein
MSVSAKEFIIQMRAVARLSTFVVVMSLTWVVTSAAQDIGVAPVGGGAPVNTVEVGAGGVGTGSYKAGEYNGLQSRGGFLPGTIDFRGGSRDGGNGGLQWRVKGYDLGLETRSVTGEIDVQSKFRVNLGYDGLRRNRSDTYQTPFNGTGTNVLSLPGTWLVPTVAGSSGTNTAVNNISARGLDPNIGGAPYVSTTTNSTMGSLLVPTAAQLALVDAASAADRALFHTVDLSTKRTRFDAGVNYSVSPTFDLTAEFFPEHKAGLKPMGTVSRNTGADISAIIPDVIDTDTNQINLSANYKGAKSFVQAGYHGSFFRNRVPFMSWQNWATPTGTVNTISSTPDNDYHQAGVTGGYSFTRTTKLVVFGSYARNTQSALFLTNPTTPIVPASSLNGLVVTTAFNAKFTTKVTRKLALATAYKFDDRDNRTPIHIFQYADAEETPTANPNFVAGPNNPLGAVVAQNANANRPYSRRVNLATFDSDYAVGKGQWVKGGVDFERINRECHGAWISCVDAAITNESSIRGEWRMDAGPDINARVGYTYSMRRTPDYNENAFLALVPYAGVVPATATGAVSALSLMTANGWTGWGPAAGFAATTGNQNLFFPSNNALANALYANNNRISEIAGMRRYYVADRDRNKLRTLVGWQATNPLSFEAGLDLTNDHYPASTYGLQDSKGWNLNLDGTYLVSANWSATVFYTYEDQHVVSAGNSYTANSNTAVITNGQPGAVGLSGNSCDAYTTLQQRNNSNKLDPCLNWSADRLDKVHTMGGGMNGRMLSSRLTLGADLIFSRARWDDLVSGGNWANNILNGPGAAPTTIAAYFIPASNLPTVAVDSHEIRFDVRYAVDARQSIRATYSHIHMDNADPMYEGMQIGAGTPSGVLPSLEQSFNHDVNVLGVSYIMRF